MNGLRALAKLIESLMDGSGLPAGEHPTVVYVDLPSRAGQLHVAAYKRDDLDACYVHVHSGGLTVGWCVIDASEPE